MPRAVTFARAAVVASLFAASCSPQAQAGNPAQRQPSQQQSAPQRPAPPEQSTTDSGPRAPIRSATPCVVVRVIDGDTIDCGATTNVRLIGIDAPELSQKPFGASSAAALRTLLPAGTAVRLELDVETHDQYKRVLAYVWTGDRMINWMMMRAGWTVLLTHAPNVQYASAFRAAEQRARADRSGLWRVDGFRCMPAAHRKNQC